MGLPRLAACDWNIHTHRQVFLQVMGWREDRLVVVVKTDLGWLLDNDT